MASNVEKNGERKSETKKRSTKQVPKVRKKKPIMKGGWQLEGNWDYAFV